MPVAPHTAPAGRVRSRASWPTTWNTWIAIALLAACGLAVYSNAFAPVFVGLDARESIRDNEHIRSLWPLSEAISLPMWSRSVIVEQSPTVAIRPAYSFLLALTYRFFGADPRAYQAVALVVHIAAALLLFGILRRTAAHIVSADRANRIAVATSMVWLVHPLQTESVTYAVQLSESLMGAMMLASLYGAIRAREDGHQRLWLAASVLAAVCAVASKQSAIGLPLLLAAYDFSFAPPPGSKRFRPGLYAATSLPILVLAYLIARGVRSAADPQRAIDYALAQPGVILHYLRLTFWPEDLYLYVNTDLFRVASAGEAALPTLILVLLLTATGVAVSRRHWTGFAGAWFFLTLGPTSSVLAISDRIQEHRMYLPLAAIALLVVVGSDFALDRLLPANRVGTRTRQRTKATVLAAVVVALGVRTYVRNLDYRHEFAVVHPADLHESYRILADHVLSNSAFLEKETALAEQLLATASSPPTDTLYAHFVLGLTHAEAGDLDEAAEQLRIVTARDPQFAYAHHWLAKVLVLQGREESAVEQFREAIRLEPGFPYSYVDLARVRIGAGDLDAGKKLLAEALAVQPGFAEAHFELGILALQQHDNATAREHLRHAVEDRPDLADARYELALLLRDVGDVDEAFEHLEAAIRYAPDNAPARYELGRLLVEKERDAEAEAEFRTAIRSQPDFADAHRELAALLVRTERYTEASEFLDEAIRLDPNSAQAHFLLGLVRRARSDLRGSIQEFRRAASLAPDEPDSLALLGIAMLEAGETADARRHLQHALKLNPKLKPARDALRRLESMRRESDTPLITDR